MGAGRLSSTEIQGPASCVCTMQKFHTPWATSYDSIESMHM